MPLTLALDLTPAKQFSFLKVLGYTWWLILQGCFWFSTQNLLLTMFRDHEVPRIESRVLVIQSLHCSLLRYRPSLAVCVFYRLCHKNKFTALLLSWSLKNLPCWYHVDYSSAFCIFTSLVVGNLTTFSSQVPLLCYILERIITILYHWKVTY